jgi:hypothetical protein
MGEHGAHVCLVHGEEHHEARFAFFGDDARRRRLRAEMPLGRQISEAASLVGWMLRSGSDENVLSREGSHAAGAVAAEGAVLDDGVEGRAPRRVGILVGVHVETPPASLLDEAQRLAYLAPVALSARLVVRDLHGDAGFLADADGLAHGIEEPGRLVPHVGGVEPAVGAELAGELDDLLGSRVPSGLVDQARGEADGARLHALAHPGPHLAHLGGGRGTLGEPHGAGPQ